MGHAIDRRLSALSAAAGLTAVALGAFGAHALGESLSAQQAEWWDTATIYLLTHAVAGLVLGLHTGTVKLSRAGLLLVLGVCLFAATLYAMALGAPRWLGTVTPIGGIGMIAGWGLVFISLLRSP